MKFQSQRSREIKELLEKKIVKHNDKFVSKETKNAPTGEVCYVKKEALYFLMLVKFTDIFFNANSRKDTLISFRIKSTKTNQKGKSRCPIQILSKIP
ncbi:hypothetical protein IGL98_003261 [Enterococcus sp. DIV0840]|uniref:hypothetical protein n=1 Tax=Enterococcus TaxID=1350 RepID=UPI001A8E664E|nr:MULTISPECIES: hypothetical protein [Enterococcus]MBO0434861.1 hypothetical protein [Enterococcus sp. DIV0849a]MBO0475284.1 hypothetical protein [Enterococcus ureasiticus]